MRKQLWMIGKVWAYRPMMWLLTIAALIAMLTSIEDLNRTIMRSAFIIPGEYGSMGSVKLTPISTLKDGEEFQKSARSGDIDTSVEGIDLTSMDLRDPTNALDAFSSLEHALANYPSVRWIRFDTDQIQHVSNETLRSGVKTPSVDGKDLRMKADQLAEGLVWLASAPADRP